jgi:Leucine-rich repeat (LRR) protein
MTISVTYINNVIKKYNSFEKIKKYDLVLKIYWSYNSLKMNWSYNSLKMNCSNNKLTGLPVNMNFPNLHIFICSFTYLTVLPENMNFPNLHTFNCSHNELTELPANMNLPNLIYLNCSNNKLMELPANMNFPNLQQFNCEKNELTVLPANMNLPNLIYLNCSNNKLTVLPANMNFPNLQQFNCFNNKLTGLSANMNFPNLQQFNCEKNELTVLPANMNFPNLQDFNCGNNKLTGLPVCFLNFRNLKQFYYGDNIIELSPQMARFINKIENIFSNKLTVYTDTQNIHNVNIQLCVKDSINKITCRTDLHKYNTRQLNTLIINNKTFTSKTKSLLLEYSNDNIVHSLLLLTFSEVLWFVIQTIITDFEIKEQTEIFNILNQEIADSECKCFTGRMNRVINCLNGFSPLVEINIKDGEQIGNIIVMIKSQLDLIGYTVEKHKEQVEKELIERGYDTNTIKLWLEYIE